MNIYTHTLLGVERAALQKLPTLASLPVKKAAGA